MVSTTTKKTFTSRSLGEMEREKWFPLAEKSVSPNRNKRSPKTWILPNFNNGFHCQKGSSKIRFH